MQIATQKRAGAQGTPGRTSEPLAVHIVPRLPRQGRYQRLQQKQGLRPPGCQPFPQPSHFAILRPFSQPNAKLVIDSLTEATSPAEKTSNEETMGSNEQFGINHGNIHQGGAEEVTYTGILHSYWSILSQSAGSAAPFYHNLQGLQGTLRQKRLWPEGIRIHQRNVVSSLPKEKTVRLASVYASCRKRACILQTKYPLDHFYTWISAFNCLEQYSAELACVLLPTLNSFYSCDKPS